MEMMRVPIAWTSLTEDELIAVIYEAAAEELRRWEVRNADEPRDPTIADEHREPETAAR